ncbi:MAG: PHP domain-containing protein [Gammaproteobacteria bacterium]|nr:PHP domain-containing protein [Gammaproteobacteria bacterium]
MRVDLHTHTSVSDGKLSVAELLSLAQKRRIDMLSITDHDTLAAYPVLESLNRGNITVVPGIEFSTRWQGVSIHIVGLNIDPGNETLKRGVEYQARARRERAATIARRLQATLGIEDPLPAVTEIAGNNNIGRPHFAQHLLAIGVDDSMEKIFRKYLGRGKAGDVKETWADLSWVTEWITAAGGIAVLAHPLKYRLTRTRLLKLLDEFVEVGGRSMEVVNGWQKNEDTDKLARICDARQLLASCGSDFHDPEFSRGSLGEYSNLPGICTPVWKAWTGRSNAEPADEPVQLL